MLQNRIALIYDCDLTLTPHYMQRPLFRHFKIKDADFWSGNTRLLAAQRAAGLRVLDEIAYMHHMVMESRPGGSLDGLTKDVLRRCGAEIEFFPGVIQFLARTKGRIEQDPRYAEYDIRVEHYIVSTGLLEMLRGSAIMPLVEHVDACEFFYDEKGVPIGIAYPLSHAEKQQTIFRINKGVFHNQEIDVNSTLPDEHRRVPIQNMIYFGDGPSDVPAMKIVQVNGGTNIAVYNPKPDNPKPGSSPGQNAFTLLEAGRAHVVYQTNFAEGSDLDVFVAHRLEQIAQRIVSSQHEHVRRVTIHPPRHTT